MTAHGPKRRALRRYYTSGVGGEADMPRSLNRRGWPTRDIRGSWVAAAHTGPVAIPSVAFSWLHWRLSLGEGDATTLSHQTNRWPSCMAARCAGAAACGAGWL